MRKSSIKIASILLLVVFLAAFKLAEEDFTKLISGKLEKFRQMYPVEKAYLHLDKPYYMTGDTLWYKAYLVEGSLHFADSASNLLYVDLIEQRTGKNWTLRHTHMDAGVGNGEIVLADSIPPGAYLIRAYTNWMRNSSEDFFFQKDIFIFDKTGNASAPGTGKVDLQFFPEGGELIAGTSTRIAFKAVNTNGLGQDIRGFVLDQNKDTVASFKSEHLGMGRIPFSPKSGATYSAFLRDQNGTITSYPFPEVKENGYTLLVDNLSNPLKTRIIAYANIPGKSELPVHVVGHSRGIVAFVARGKIGAKGLMMLVPNTDLPDGITHLTLFNSENKPVSERLIFIDHAHKLRIGITPSRNTFRPREKSEIEITVSDTSGKPLEANLSVAVTDAGQIQQQTNDQHILSYLLLSSDIKGFIEQPSYYFDETKAERKIHRDILLMTQGWTRFRWDEVLKDSLQPAERFLEQGITFSGEVTRNNKKPVEKTPLSVYLSNDSLNSFLTAETDELGRFTLYNLIFEDSLRIRVQGMNKKNNQNLTIKVLPFAPPKVSQAKTPYFPLTIDGQLLSEFLKRNAQDQEIARKIRESRERLLQEVTIKAKKEVQRDSRKIYGTPDASIKMTPQLVGGRTSVLDILAGRVAGVQVVGSGMNASVYIRGNRNEPQFVLDGMPVDKDFISSMNVNDVESIDVLKGASAAIFGMGGGNGVISILTKRGNDNYDYSQEIVPGVLASKIAGFHIPKAFYSPAYPANAAQNVAPDYRSTIFWAPMLKTDKNGKVRLQYYNSDAATTVDIRVEALSATGLPGFGKSTYSVN
ncbi:TonB-dependent receptor plug domain-containing protein [Dyadobacter aurulentus]|uniref:TonB-dependent receptor plug domain-containing protein n=1 Tax=Dyadobacter sp. UC 10 TaxID=2605428 RepID=UPI0011F396CE|nr:TonB-dependent receptor plug domain-containing protein [Dyadobacter sp. UC 10]KAA0990660.1 TonB-dependent receptor plug domain-containing protein [Dyadobacter sp. UC 10]